MATYLEIPVIPAKNSETPVSGVFISDDKGNVEASATIPGNIQNNIEAEKIKFSDSAINNSSVNTHGFIKKLSGTATEFMNGAGNWTRLSAAGLFGNIYKVESTETVVIGANYENVVSNMIIEGALSIEGRLKILG